MTVLNCGREVGEIVDMYGDQEIVIGESVNDAYALEEDQEWWWESVPCEYQWVTGSLKGIAARDPRLTPGGVYGYALKFATIDPDVRPENFVDFVQIELES